RPADRDAREILVANVLDVGPAGVEPERAGAQLRLAGAHDPVPVPPGDRVRSRHGSRVPPGGTTCIGTAPTDRCGKPTARATRAGAARARSGRARLGSTGAASA